MQEIWIPESLITLFLFLHIIRPAIKQFRDIDGLAWLPLLSLLLAITLFPAYGFRPEIIPLLLYAAVLAALSIIKHSSLSVKYRSYRKAKLIFVLPPLIILAAAVGIVFFFTPQRDTALSTEGVYTQRIKSGTAGDRGQAEYLIRVYTDENDFQPSRRPLLIILSPALGSLSAVDMVSTELRDRGFTVLAVSARYGASPAKWFRRINAFSSGTVSAGANARGRGLEEERREDLMFLLSWIVQNPRLEEKGPLFDIASRDAVFLAGYNTGGSALVLLDYSFSAMRIRGLIAIESPLWSLYRKEENENPPLSVDAGWYESVRYGLSNWFWRVKPKKITGLGQIPNLSIPLLFMVSGRNMEPKFKEGKFLALFKTLEAAQPLAALASVDNSGPLDYSDFPVKYPIITFLYGGRKTAGYNLEAPATTAAIITHFAVETLKAGNRTSIRLDNAPLPAGVKITLRH